MSIGFVWTLLPESKRAEVVDDAVNGLTRGDIEHLLGLDLRTHSEYRWVNMRRTSVLLPTGLPRVAAAALLRRSAHTSVISVAGRRVLASALRGVGLLDRRTRRAAVFASPMMDWISETLACPNPVVVATFGPPRPNDKPVLQVLDRRGMTLAWAKIGWSPLTRGLVQHERRILTELAGRSGWLEVPQPIAITEVDGCTISMHSALPVWNGDHRRVEPAVARLSTLIAESGEATVSAVEGSEYLARLADRCARVQPVRANVVARRIVDRLTGEFGDLPLRCGRWHGDLSRWNLDWQVDKALVWDWERSAECVPVGLDAIHYSVGGTRGARAAALAHAASGACVVGAGQESRIAPLLERAYHLEIFLRREEEQREAPTCADPTAVAEQLARLEQYA